jgi:hypothetical protein
MPSFSSFESQGPRLDFLFEVSFILFELGWVFTKTELSSWSGLKDFWSAKNGNMKLDLLLFNDDEKLILNEYFLSLTGKS